MVSTKKQMAHHRPESGCCLVVAPAEAAGFETVFMPICRDRDGSQ